MDWVQLLSIKRFGLEDYHSEKNRSERNINAIMTG